jgi:hypothetical protein
MLPDLLSPLLDLLPAGARDLLAGPAGAIPAAALVALLLGVPSATRPGAIGAALLVAVLWVLPPIWPSPRQVPERLPLLAAGLFVLPLVLVLARVPAPLARGVPLLAAAWWMAGAPLWWPDAVAAAATLGGLAAAGMVWATRPAVAGGAAGVAAALAVGLGLAGWGLGVMSWLAAAVAVAAGLGALLRAGGPAAEAATGGLLVALAAVPLLARGQVLDLLAATAGAVALLAAPLGTRIAEAVLQPGAARTVGPLLVALPVLAALAWLSGHLG